MYFVGNTITFKNQKSKAVPYLINISIQNKIDKKGKAVKNTLRGTTCPGLYSVFIVYNLQRAEGGALLNLQFQQISLIERPKVLLLFKRTEIIRSG